MTIPPPSTFEPSPASEDSPEPRDLLALYAMDALAPDEHARVAAWLADDPAGRAELAQLRRSVDALPYAAPPQDPSPATRSAFLRRIAVEPQVVSAGTRDSAISGQGVQDASTTMPKAPISTRMPDDPAGSRRPGDSRRRSSPDGDHRSLRPAWSWTRVFGGALLTASLVAAGLAIGEVGRLNDRNDRLTAERDDARATAVALDSALAVAAERAQLERELAAGLRLPGSEEIVLADTEGGIRTGARLVAAADRGAAVLVVDRLPGLSREQVYQLWLIEGETPVSAGTFRVAADGKAVVPLPPGADLSSFEAVGVSIEPDGGSETPTGPIVLLGARGG